jgi:signal transduction histidine kinase
MTTEQESQTLDTLLLEREARGLHVPVLARIVLLFFAFGNLIVSIKPGIVADDRIWFGFIGLVSLSLLVNVYLYSLLRRNKHVEVVGLVGSAFDVLFFLGLMFALQRIGTEPGLTLAFVWKSELALIPAVLIAINGLALRPRYPIIVAVGVTLVQLIGYGRVLTDPRTQYSSLPAESYAGPAIDPFQIPNSIFFVASIGAAVAFITYVARKTIRKAIANELLHAKLQREQLELVMREKVEALAKLVAGVSHEINSPAGVILSGVETQARVLDEVETQVANNATSNPKLGRVLEAARSTGAAMQEAARRITSTTKSLRAFAHLDEADFQKIDLHREIDNVLELIPSAIRGETELERTYDDDLPELHVQAKEITQVLMTILQNAFEANGGSGTVTVRTSCQSDKVLLTISDNGKGIPPEQLDALFDVSVRNKENRMVAGFGLPGAQAVAHRHGGEITVESALGKGSEFTLHLPVR